MRIGELSKRSGIPVQTLRYYDEIGLLKPQRRHPISRFREYGEDAFEILHLIRAGKTAGLSLRQIRRIVDAARRGAACEQVVPLLNDKIEEIDQAIGSLRRLRGRLRRALKRGGPKPTPAGACCPILQGLEEGDRSRPNDEKPRRPPRRRRPGRRPGIPYL